MEGFEAVWEKLLKGITEIYQLQPMTYETRIKYYTLVFNYCTDNNNQKSELNQQHNEQIVGRKLYMEIKNYDSVGLQGDDIVRFYAHRWSKYQFSSKILDKICLYLNTYFVRQCIDGGETDVDKVSDMLMKIWENVYFQLLQKQVTEACLNSIKAERKNEVSNTNLINEVIQSYVALDCCSSATSLTIYKQYFEDQFLHETEEFYQLEAATFLQHNSVTKYLRKVARHLDEEARRVQLYLHPSTLPSLIKKVEDVLIRDRLDLIYTESEKLLRDEKYQDLILLFQLISRIPNTTERLKEIVKKHIHQMGLNAIECISGTGLPSPTIYIKTILSIHQKSIRLVKDVFNNEQKFLAALDAACVKFINRNIVTESTANVSKSPEFLARYCDALLRKGNKGVEEICNAIMTVFHYVKDKDVFDEFYRKLLAKRLVRQLSTPDDYEASMFSKLKEKCGYKYTLKLQKLFEDITLSKTLSQKYRTYCESQQSNDIEFSIIALRCDLWSFSTPPNIILPVEIQQMVDSFTKFYSHQHSRLTLMWLYQYSKGELQTSFNEKKYVLKVSTCQMTVLLLFNQQTTWTVEQIQDKTQIAKTILFQLLSGLLQVKLLICEEINKKVKESNIQMNYRMTLADNFESEGIEIDLHSSLKSVQQKENASIHRIVEKDRKLLIQATIIRVMKARQTLERALLMQEVVEQLTSRLEPQIPAIKKCIDILIEKDYLERNAEDKNLLHYLP